MGEQVLMWGFTDTTTIMGRRFVFFFFYLFFGHALPTITGGA